MKLDSVRSLKAELMSKPTPLPTIASFAASAAGFARTALPAVRPTAAIALGICGRTDYRLAVRVRHMVPGVGRAVAEIERRSRGECEVRVVGRVVAQAPRRQREIRPLEIGLSVMRARNRGSAGTLGCFVTRGERELLLSNNHVLANENRARSGDSIVQPGGLDYGSVSGGHRVARLDRFVRLEARRNRVDGATAQLADGIEYFVDLLRGRGLLRGVRTQPIDSGTIVYKLGRTTALRRGKVSAVELDGLEVEYDGGDLLFDDQIEIEPDESRPFSLGGDSGSLVFDARGRAVGLLFAGNDVDATYANPIDAVTSALGVELAF